MPVLGCGAEIGKLMDVSDQDVASIEEVIAERLALGVSQAQAQRQAVDEVLAQLAEERSMVMKAVQEQLGFDPREKPAPAFSNKTIDDPQVGISVALLELGKRSGFFRLPKSTATDLDQIASDKGMTVTLTRDAGKENAEFLAGMDVQEDPYQDAMGTAGRRAVANLMAASKDSGQLKTWQARTTAGAEGTIMQDGNKVWINVAGTGEDRGGSAIYDLVANYAHNNGLKFIGDPDGLKAPAMRRRLENMLNAAIKYGSTDFLVPHERQLAGDKSIGVPALKWTEGDTLANIRNMVDVSVAANRYTNPITTSILQYDSNNDTYADDSGTEFSGEDLRATLDFDSRSEGIGQAGKTTLLRTALFNTLLQGPGARREFLAALHRQSGESSPGVPAPLRNLGYANKQAPDFYSALSRSVDGMNVKAMPPGGWKDGIKGLVNKGAIKQDEVEWSGVNDWLDMQTGKVTKERVTAYLDTNGVRVEETVLSDEERLQSADARFATRFGPNQFAGLSLPGGENYREVLLTLPQENMKTAREVLGEPKEMSLEEAADVIGMDADDFDTNPNSTVLIYPNSLYIVKKASGEYYTMVHRDDILTSNLDEAEKFLASGMEGEVEELDTGAMYQSSHWKGIPNVLAHIRLNDRTDSDGNKVLFVEEVQSDWAQQGRKEGFADPKAEQQLSELAKQYDLLGAQRRAAEKEMSDLPDYNERFAELQDRVEAIGKERDSLSSQMDELRSKVNSPITSAPFVDKTDKWLNLALKRIIKMAVDGGYDKVAFVNGEQSADRYSLSKKVDRIEFNKNPDGTFAYQVQLLDSDSDAFDRESATLKEVEETFGKGIAETMNNAPARAVDGDSSQDDQYPHTIEGDGLDIGGDGMKDFYNNIVPKAAARLAEKLGGAKMETVTIPDPQGTGRTMLTRNMFGEQQTIKIDDEPPLKQPGFPITDKMRETAGAGLPLFANKAQTETPEFKRWFGNSQIVDADGKPLVVYHGTDADFNVFDRKKQKEGRLGKGFYFTSSPEEAKSYGKNVLAVYLQADRLFNGRTRKQTGEGKTWAMEYMLTAGGGRVFLVMNPKQIKSATDNNGQFDPKNPDIRFANKPQTDTPAFRKWFGDSKVVDANGKPLVAYRGMTKDMDEGSYRISESGTYGPGIYFSTDPSVASFWAGNREDDGMENEYGGHVAPVYVAIKNPAEGDTAAEIESKFRSRARDEMIRRGYDGVITDDGEIVAFYPHQIKSAIGNNGKFDGTNPDIRFANKPTSPYRDAAGRAKFPPGVIAYKLLGKAARPFVDKLLLTSASPETRRELRQMKLDVQKAMDTTAEVATAVNKMSDDERRMISDVIEKEVKAGVTPSANAVQTAAMMNEAFETQTNELVRLGMLTQDAADKWRGKYLPRFYESKLKKPQSEAWADVFGLTNSRPRVLAGIKGNHLKSRGLTYTVYAKDLPEWESKGWEIRDTKYTPGDTTVQIWRDFTPKEREQMGEIRDAGFRFVMGYMQTQKDIALGRMYERVSQNPEMAADQPLGEDWVQVPDTKIPETGAMRYGKLAGKYVAKDMMLQLNNFAETEGDFMRLYKQALSLWKEAKTVLNPVSHVNNFVSNATMAHFAGVSYWDQHKYAGTVKDLAQGLKNPMVKEAREAGLFLGSFTDEEISNILPPELQAMVNKQDSKGVAAARLTYNVLTWGLRKPMQKAYEFGDSFFKYMLYKDARNRGASPEDAVNHAQSFIFNYDDLPTGARRIRDFGLPFFSYTYKAVPRLAETFLTRPDRFFAPAGVIFALGAMGYAAAAGGDDDWLESVKRYLTDEEFRKKADDLREEEYKLLPEWMKGRSALGTLKQIRLGTDEATGNPVFLDVSRFIPGGDLFDINSNAGGIPMLQPITPSNPLLSIYSTMIANKDPFFGKDLVKDTDTGWEATKKRADYMWKLASPAIAIGNVHWDRATNAVASVYGDELPYLPDMLGGSNTGIGRDGQPVQPKYAAMQSVGIKARPMDMDMSEQIQKSQKNKTLRDLEAELRQARRYNSKGILSDRAFEKREEYIRQKMDNVREGLTVSGDEK